eukprot:TRINITY_DN8655_c0_g1_i1.p1 TRINITY_DN8655_c0_g1~~TRINITY_DN8655_c0_g1_i1.p1  ORF type:complete len:149 (-),score=16.79 TRINITY_DN8655_c0_g1_i1:231-647(-)
MATVSIATSSAPVKALKGSAATSFRCNELSAAPHFLRPPSAYESSKNRTGLRHVAVRGFFGGRKSSEKAGDSGTKAKGCARCSGTGAIDCPGCKGSGKNRKNGNVLERWKCFNCQGFGLVKCPKCGKQGLTPEQRGDR